MANKRFLDFTTDVTPSGSNFLLEADDVNGVRKSTIENAVAGTNVVTNMLNKVANVFYNNAAAHNGIYRGKDLTAYFDNGDMSAAISTATFDDIYIGDYITKTITLPAITYTNKSGTEITQPAQTFANVKWLVAGIDTHLYCGDTDIEGHHVLLIPNDVLQRNVKMNPTNDTTGGYLGTDMWRVHIPNWSVAIKNAFGDSHVLSHRELLSDQINTDVQSTAGGFTGKSSRYSWTSVDVNIPNEPMVYGCSVWGSTFDVGEYPRILPLYALRGTSLDGRAAVWLRAVASRTAFSCAYTDRSAAYLGASDSGDNGGILPYFLLK